MKHLANAFFLTLGLSFLGACAGGSDPATTNVTIAVTDAASDEIDMFEVDVKDIVLTRLDGSTVSLMTQATRVDFAQLESLSELLVGSSIPVGIYQRIAMTLDFANASVCIAGQTTPATVLDAFGVPITGEISVNVSFAANLRPNIVVGRNHLFILDLDLDQSLTVNAGSNQVTFSPVATAKVDPSNPKPVFTTGVLDAVDVAAGELTVQRRTPNGATIGTYIVSVSGSTVYQIDGNNQVGASGLTALAALGGTPRIFVQGTVNGTDRKLNAVAIETGAGTPGNGQDFVIGHILSRDNGAGSNATLTVKGFSLDESSGVRRFNTVHTITVDFAVTNVLRRLSGSGLTTDNLQVGQRIAAFGVLSGTALDATDTSGIVRMLKTSVWGTANSAPSGGTLTLNLTRIGRRPIGSFNFTVGSNPQSTATAYTVDVSGLSTAGVAIGSKIRAIGFTNAVDVNGDNDFLAESFINHSTTASLLLCQWIPANVAAISSATSTEITLDVSSALIKVVGDGFGTTVLSNTPSPAKIEPLLGTGIYRIVENGGVELHVRFDTFAESLNSRISPTSSVFRVAAFGTFDAATQTFDALIVSVILL